MHRGRVPKAVKKYLSAVGAPERSFKKKVAMTGEAHLENWGSRQPPSCGRYCVGTIFESKQKGDER